MSKKKKNFVYYVDNSGVYKLTVEHVNKNLDNVTSTQATIITPGYEELGKFKHVAPSLVQKHFLQAREKYLELLQEEATRLESQLDIVRDIIASPDTYIKPI